MRKPIVSIIVLTNKLFDDTFACLDSVFQSDYENFQVILLDNLSDNGLIAIVQKEYPNVQIVPLTENLGYAGNNNIGIETALTQNTDWVFILNDDTVLDPSCISLLIQAVENDSEIGIIGPMVYHFDEPNIIQSAGGMLDKYWNIIHVGQNKLDRGQFFNMQRVDWISGCAIMVRRAVIEQVGMFDPGYFLYWEETEWCLRAGRAGWKIVNNPQARLWHKGVQRDYQPEPYVTYYVTRNHLFTLSKYKAPLNAWIYTLVQIVRSLVSWTVKPQWGYKREHRNAMWRGLVDFIKHRQGPMPSYLVI